VKWFDENRGYGMIRESTGRELPVCYEDIEGEGYKSVAEGEAVEFSVIKDAKGMRACRVRRMPSGDE